MSLFQVAAKLLPKRFFAVGTKNFKPPQRIFGTTLQRTFSLNYLAENQSASVLDMCRVIRHPYLR